MKFLFAVVSFCTKRLWIRNPTPFVFTTLISLKILIAMLSFLLSTGMFLNLLSKSFDLLECFPFRLDTVDSTLKQYKDINFRFAVYDRDARC